MHASLFLSPTHSFHTFGNRLRPGHQLHLRNSGSSSLARPCCWGPPVSVCLLSPSVSFDPAPPSVCLESACSVCGTTTASTTLVMALPFISLPITCLASPSSGLVRRVVRCLRFGLACAVSPVIHICRRGRSDHSTTHHRIWTLANQHHLATLPALAPFSACCVLSPGVVGAALVN
jgi:hypothetical protein